MLAFSLTLLPSQCQEAGAGRTSGYMCAPAPPPNLTVLHRRAGYIPTTDYIEPETIALLGISHRSPYAADHVKDTIQNLQPDAVVVELCRLRAGMLQAPHGEFRAARDAALATGAQLVLGDLPVARTLRRVVAALSWPDRLALLRGAAQTTMQGMTGIDPALAVSVATGDGVAVEPYLELLKQRFPGVERPLVTERDMYLAWSAKRSRAVHGARCVVVVVGAAHVPGIARWICEDNERRTRGEPAVLRFRDLIK